MCVSLLYVIVVIFSQIELFLWATFFILLFHASHRYSSSLCRIVCCKSFNLILSALRRFHFFLTLFLNLIRSRIFCSIVSVLGWILIVLVVNSRARLGLGAHGLLAMSMSKASPVASLLVKHLFLSVIRLVIV